MQNAYSPKPRLRATVEQLVAEAAIGDPRAQQQLDEFARHPVIGRVIAEVLAEAEAALKPSEKQLLSVQEKAPEKPQQDQGSGSATSEGVFCTASRGAIVADANERWGGPRNGAATLAELQKLWKPGREPSGVQRQLQLHGWRGVLGAVLPGESAAAFKQRVARGHVAAAVCEDFWSGQRHRARIRGIKEGRIA